MYHSPSLLKQNKCIFHTQQQQPVIAHGEDHPLGATRLHALSQQQFAIHNVVATVAASYHHECVYMCVCVFIYADAHLRMTRGATLVLDSRMSEALVGVTLSTRRAGWLCAAAPYCRALAD